MPPKATQPLYMNQGVLSVQGVSIQSISNAGGDKRGTRSSSRGEGAVDTNKSPLPLPPRGIEYTALFTPFIVISVKGHIHLIPDIVLPP
ncbi:hypothetical protein KUCAC02_027259 [Chaenocephalus aceratus]|uniref:Uncharacterized protein n=1 Tax=Chaenocephalus aceratus TaxID=36190 RepID=A0ACB9W4N6_CHAAC|nr:hypothetical protein KUCAC02_027259 [Chaenocephalus aceratus]